MIRRLLFLVLCISWAFPLWAGDGYLFVEPFRSENSSQTTSLKEAPIVRVQGGRAFRFREITSAENRQVARLQDALKQSKAFAQTLELLNLARKIAPAPSQSWLQSANPLPIWVFPAGAGKKGPGLYSPLPVQVQTSTNTFESPCLLVIESLQLPGKTLASPEELQNIGMLVPMICHELFHAIQAELYKEKYLLLDLLSQMPGAPHDSPLETDPQLAFKEGFAEAGEVWLGTQFPGEYAYPLPGNHQPALVALARETAKRRIKLAERNRYIFSANGQVKDGKLKPGNTDFATEGVISSLLFTLVGHADFSEPWRAVFTAMAHGAPTSFFEFTTLLMRENPAQAATIRRILLEYTCYTISSPMALEKYEQYYVARKAFLIGSVKREEYEKARQAWEAWKEAQRRKIADGAALCEAVPQPLIVTSRQGMTLDLNDEQADRLAWHLEAFIPPENQKDASRLAGLYAGRIIEKRKTLGTFESVRQVEDILPGWLYEKCLAGFKRYAAQSEKALDQELSRRRQLKTF